MAGMAIESSGWYGVRCLFEHAAYAGHSYEERVTLWPAGSPDEAIELAEVEAEEYAEALTATRYLGLAQAYAMADTLGRGAEVFSLIRDSGLEADAYVNAFFATGAEYLQTSDGSAGVVSPPPSTRE
jgi:hypothetical protein